MVSRDMPPSDMAAQNDYKTVLLSVALGKEIMASQEVFVIIQTWTPQETAIEMLHTAITYC